ncbi:MAG: nucleotide sugar dehydrogenase, partial [Candidatus Competibacteraceae bacterium]|nr:nucleotide sugar dehydrogenase [Candidatus Competibacteraceae bacterium]
DHPQVVKGASVVEDLDIVLDNADAIFIGTGHSYYKDMLTVDKLKEKGIRFILDGRNCLEGNDFRSSDIYYKGIGR